MARFLDSIGLAYFWEKIKSLVQQNTHEYSVEELETPTAGYRNSFRLDKDGDAITGSDTIDIPTELTPIVSKQYLDDTFYASTTSVENSSRYFMTVTPDAANTFWYVKFRVRVWIPVDTTDKRFTDSIIEYFGSGISMKGYRIWNTINTGSAAYYQAAFWLTASGLTNGFGHVLGTSIRYGTNYTNSAWYRYVKVDLLAYEGCSVGVFDALTKWTPYKESVGASSSDYLTDQSTYNATSQGLQETGDATDTTTMQLYYAKVISGTYGIKNRSLIMEDGNGKWQSFTTTSGTGTSKTKNDSGFRLGSHIYYASTSTDIAADTAIGSGIVRAFISIIDLRYSLNINTTAGGTANNLLPYKPVYIVGTIGNDGLFYLDDVWWTQTEPSTENNKIYIKVAEAVYNDYENNRCYRADLLSSGHAYWYKDGRFQRYYGDFLPSSTQIPDDTNLVHKAGAETITGEKTFSANVNLTEGATLNMVYDSQTPDGVYLQATEPNGIKAVSFSGISDDGMVQIKHVYVPTEDTDAANKYYVDESILDIDEYRVYFACQYGPYGVHQKSLCAFCLTNGGREMKMTSFTKTSGTGAKEVITDLVFPIGCKIYYNDASTDLPANLSSMANRYYTSFNGVDVRYSAITGTNISLGNHPSETQSTVYLHVIVENGYWRPYYKEGATNEIIVDSFHMQSGNFYIYLGKTVGSTGYKFQLEDNNPLYYYDGTKLIDWASYQASEAAPSYTAGDGISISNGVISCTPRPYKKEVFTAVSFNASSAYQKGWQNFVASSNLEVGTYKVTLQVHLYIVSNTDNMMPAGCVVNAYMRSKATASSNYQYILGATETFSGGELPETSIPTGRGIISKALNVVGFMEITGDEDSGCSLEVGFTTNSSLNVMIGNPTPLDGSYAGLCSGNDFVLLEKIA